VSFVVDASVAVKWFADEEDSDRADAMFEGVQGLLAPSLIHPEVANALWKKVRSGALTHAQAASAIASLARYFDAIVPAEDLAPRAFTLALDLAHPVYDCFYIALAERQAVPLVTADRRLLTLAGRVGSVEITPLSA